MCLHLYVFLTSVRTVLGMVLGDPCAAVPVMYHCHYLLLFLVVAPVVEGASAEVMVFVVEVVVGKRKVMLFCVMVGLWGWCNSWCAIGLFSPYVPIAVTEDEPLQCWRPLENSCLPPMGHCLMGFHFLFHSLSFCLAFRVLLSFPLAVL